MTPAPCRRASDTSNSASTSPFAASRWLTGSSSSMKSKGWHKARTKATRCRWPNESSPTGVSRLSAIPAAPSSPSIRSAVWKRVRSFFSAMFSATVSSPKSRRSWNSRLSDVRRTSPHAARESVRQSTPSKRVRPA